MKRPVRVYDITVPLDSSTVIWDDGTPPRLETLLDLARGDFATVTQFAMGSHSGTHTDAPAHFVSGAATIDKLSPEVLVGPALVVHHTGAGHITAEDVDALGITAAHDRVLFKTANERLRDLPGFQRDFIALAESGAARLLELGVKLVAMDYLGIEPYEAGDDCPTHKRLMSAGVVIVEGVDLREVPPGEYLLACAPLKLVGAEGAPTRAFLVAQ